MEPEKNNGKNFHKRAIILLPFIAVIIGSLLFLITSSFNEEGSKSIPTKPQKKKQIKEIHISILKGAAKADYSPAYAPFEVKVKQGDIISWTNKDKIEHAVNSGSFGDSAFGAHFAFLIRPGQTFSLDTKDLKPGPYKYFCGVHPNMLGNLYIQDGESSMPPIGK